MNEHARLISRDEVNALPIRRYEGEVLLVESAADLERALADCRAERVAGFDTETRPSFRPGESYPPALAQFATARAVYLFRLQRPEQCAAVVELLAHAGLVKAGVSVADDLKALKKMTPFEERSVVDLGVIARQRGMKQTGVRNLAALLLGFRIPKGTKTSNWAARQLSPQQIGYAATDAWACRELYLKIKGPA